MCCPLEDPGNRHPALTSPTVRCRTYHTPYGNLWHRGGVQRSWQTKVFPQESLLPPKDPEEDSQERSRVRGKLSQIQTEGVGFHFLSRASGWCECMESRAELRAHRFTCLRAFDPCLTSPYLSSYSPPCAEQELKLTEGSDGSTVEQL